MSTFSGLINEYAFLSVDSFEPKVNFYFISHYHTDHVKGIDNAIFENEYIYCSEETKLLLLADKNVKHVHQNLYALPLNEKTEINIESPDASKKYQLDVTLIQAGHCVGSVMFLFEGENGRVLYTGDFRFKVGDTARVKAFHEADKPKTIDCLYLDTTFFNPMAQIIPSREQCAKAILKVVKKWLDKSEDHVVRIATRTRFSFDYLISQLRLKFRMKVHVTHEQRDQYRFMPHLQDNFTVYPNETRIHNCWAQSCHWSKLPCSYVPSSCHPAQVLTILPTTLYFQERYSFNQLIIQKETNMVRACYNHHSSHIELEDMIRYLKPERIVPCVVTFGDNGMDAVQQRLDEMLKHIREDFEEEAKPFGKLKSPKRFKYHSILSTSTTHEEDSESQLHFPSSSGTALRKFINLSPNAKLSPPTKLARLSSSLRSTSSDRSLSNSFISQSGLEDEANSHADNIVHSRGDDVSTELDESIHESTTTNENVESSISLSFSQDELSTQISVQNEKPSSQESVSHSPSMLTQDKSAIWTSRFSSSPIPQMEEECHTRTRVSNLFDDLVSLSSSDDVEEVIDLTQSSDDE